MSTDKRRIQEIQDYLKIINSLSKIKCFYMTKERLIKYGIKDFSCPSFVEKKMEAFLYGDFLEQLESPGFAHVVLAYGIHFIIFCLPQEEGYVLMGPLRYRKPSRDEVMGYLKKYRLEKKEFQVLSKYLEDITDECISGDPLRYLAHYRYQIDMSDIKVERVYYEEVQEKNISVKRPAEEELGYLDERFEAEQMLISMVAQGKRREAGIILEKMETISYSLRDGMNDTVWLLSLNTICKQALAKAQIPLAYIEQIYASYIRDISNERGMTNERQKMYSARMLDDYCKTARDYVAEHTQVQKSVKKAMDYILLNYSSKISVKDIAEYLKITPNYLSSVFKKQTGVSLTVYINEVRINSSLSMLANTDRSIQEVAEWVGIEDGNYFSRIFRKTMGVSPSQYRKKYSRMAEQMGNASFSEKNVE